MRKDFILVYTSVAYSSEIKNCQTKSVYKYMNACI